MRICFISFEYPPDTGIGGIATYVRQMARLFSARGIHVEVICASQTRSGTWQEGDFLTVTRIRSSNTEEFRVLSPAMAAQRHRQNPIDVIETPEYGAEALHVKEHLPDIPLVIKLHTPWFLVKETNDRYKNTKILRRLQRALGPGYRPSGDPEYQAIRSADHLLAPSRSLREIVMRRWGIPEGKILHAPNPYFPSDTLLQIREGGPADQILYIGRLETRKGVYNLAKAMPRVLQAVPSVRFTFLGKDCRGPFREKSMRAVMQKEMGAAAAHATFIDHVPAEQVPDWVARAGICVFPSLWENFPNVCLEAMSAARGIVAGREGGMKDMLEDIDGGILVDPEDTPAIAEALIRMITDDAYRTASARRSRDKAARYYGNRLVDELETMYRSFV